MIRLVRLGHMFPDVQEFLLVAVKSSSVVFPLLLILALLTYLWSVCGVVLFGNDTYLADLFGDGKAWEAVNRHQGFFGVAQGMQTMLGVATTPGSDGWVALMQRYQDVTDTRCVHVYRRILSIEGPDECLRDVSALFCRRMYPLLRTSSFS